MSLFNEDEDDGLDELLKAAPPSGSKIKKDTAATAAAQGFKPKNDKLFVVNEDEPVDFFGDFAIDDDDDEEAAGDPKTSHNAMASTDVRDPVIPTEEAGHMVQETLEQGSKANQNLQEAEMKLKNLPPRFPRNHDRSPKMKSCPVEYAGTEEMNKAHDNHGSAVATVTEDASNGAQEVKELLPASLSAQSNCAPHESSAGVLGKEELETDPSKAAEKFHVQAKDQQGASAVSAQIGGEAMNDDPVKDSSKTCHTFGKSVPPRSHSDEKVTSSPPGESPPMTVRTESAVARVDEQDSESSRTVGLEAPREGQNASSFAVPAASMPPPTNVPLKRPPASATTRTGLNLSASLAISSKLPMALNARGAPKLNDASAHLRHPLQKPQAATSLTVNKIDREMPKSKLATLANSSASYPSLGSASKEVLGNVKSHAEPEKRSPHPIPERSDPADSHLRMPATAKIVSNKMSVGSEDKDHEGRFADGSRPWTNRPAEKETENFGDKNIVSAQPRDEEGEPKRKKGRVTDEKRGDEDVVMGSQASVQGGSLVEGKCSDISKIGNEMGVANPPHTTKSAEEDPSNASHEAAESSLPSHEGDKGGEVALARAASVDFAGCMNRLETMILEAREMQFQALDVRAQTAILSNKMARMDNPLLRARIQEVKRKQQTAISVVLPRPCVLQSD